MFGKKILSDKKIFMYEPYQAKENKKKNNDTERSEKNKFPFLFRIRGRIAYHHNKSKHTFENELKKISHIYILTSFQKF